ncbi:MAG: hypothetical protein QM731_25640 [Chitinophagaceae bacterium]
MLYRLAFSIIILSSCSLQAQTASMVGDYYLTGVMETASGFRLNADSTFEFFFSQGALDRAGSGTWSIKNNTIFFNSKRRPPLDFALVESRKVPGDSVVIVIKDRNTALLRYVDCLLKGSGGSQKGTTDADGVIVFPAQDVDAISLIFQLCPDRYSEFIPESRNRNYFVFRFEPWIADVFFDHFHLTVLNNRLTGLHPLLKGDNFQYVRSKSE